MRRKITSILFFWMFCCLLPTTLLAQTRTITGTVKNQLGEAIPNATVQQQGTQNATKCDEEGSFSLQVTGRGTITLLVSSVGYKNTSVEVSGSTTQVTLEAGAEGTMSEVVVTALGIKKERK
ncbi:MAG TPA: carboxypeptidase-like regulatory domain-containing protein, partial [Niabella sp.]|nr:carboxypeptidase-like regulatory domain-containing protein [Niabella sp.]